MRAYFAAAFLFLNSCSQEIPSSVCDLGEFVMTLKNQDATIRYDSTLRAYTLSFSVDGSLKNNTYAVPCNLDSRYKGNFDIVFDGNLFEFLEDSTKVKMGNYFVLDLKKIKYQ